MNSQRQDDFRIAEQAAEWAGTLDSAGPQEHAAFIAWLKQSSRHVEEFLLASAIYRELDGIDPQRRADIDALLAQGAANVVPLQVASEPHFTGAERSANAKVAGTKNSARFRRSQYFGIAAGLAVLVTGLWWAQRFFEQQSYVTSVGEQRAVELPDGSLVHLNTRSKVRIEYSGQARDIQLLAGEALFKVAQDAAHPFRVHTRDGVIQALGTQFNVYRRANGTAVSVVEGKVALYADGRENDRLPLTVGEEAFIDTDGAIRRAPKNDLAKTMAWRQRRMVFKEDRLADVIAEFNRYNRSPQIKTNDPEIAELRLTAVFDADAPESLLRFLADTKNLSVHRNNDMVLIGRSEQP